MTAGLGLHHVCHATFEELSEAGYTIQSVDDGAVPVQLNESMLHGMPEYWKQPEPVIVPKVAILENATLFGDGSALLPDGLYSNYDSSFNAEPWRERFARRNMSVMQYIDLKYNDALIEFPPHSMAVEGRCFAALHNHSNNFGHFMHDILSRIYYEDLGLISPGREKIIMPHTAFPMANLLFKKVFADYEIVPFPSRDTALEIEELVLPANLCSSTCFNPSCIAALAKRMHKIMKPFVGADKHKICVSREDGDNFVMRRKFANIEQFKNRVEKLGFRIVEASKFKPESQFALWANATDIIGVHGAGLMNLVMMLPGNGFTEISGAPSPLDGTIFTPTSIARCALAFGHTVNVLASKMDPEGRPAIDLERLDVILSS